MLQGGQLPLPGVLAGWRSDLQGKMRPDSLQLDRDVYVQTSYGQVQGFKTYLYDNPDPLSGYRPGQTPVERVQGVVHTFLGVPYAQPPVNEGRFKVRISAMAMDTFVGDCTWLVNAGRARSKIKTKPRIWDRQTQPTSDGFNFLCGGGNVPKTAYEQSTKMAIEGG